VIVEEIRKNDILPGLPERSSRTRVTIFATDQQAAAAQAKKQLNLQQQVQEALR
jgi:hypothetical protein